MAKDKLSSKSISEDFVDWSLGISSENIPNEVKNKLKLILLDSFGLMIAARNQPYIKSLMSSFTATGNCAAIGHKKNLSPFDAITLNGTAIHGEDFDDTFEGTPVHIGSVIIPSILAATQYFNLKSENIVSGMAVGTELICRLALVSPTAIHRQGFHPTAILGALGATIGISKAIGNDKNQSVSSLGIVGSMASGIIEYLAEGTWTKRLHPGWAGACGWKASLFGKNKFIGPRTIFEGEHGIFSAFADKKILPDFSLINYQLGSKWFSSDLALKPYACGTMTQPFIDCAIKAKNKIDLKNIVEIVCKVGEGTVHRLWEPLLEKQNPSTPYSAKFSVPFCIAIGLLYGKAGLEEFSYNNIKNSELLNLASKVKYEIDPKNEYPKNYTGKIIIRTNKGNEITLKQDGLRGGKNNPMSYNEIENKFYENLKFGNISNEEMDKTKLFVDSFFEKPNFQLLK